MEANDLSLAEELAATYVTKIEAAYQEELTGHERQVGNIVEVGRLILEAKEAVGHGKFTPYVKEKLSFGIDKAEARMTIARCPEIANSANWRILPSYASTLEALAKVDKQTSKGTLAGCVPSRVEKRCAASRRHIIQRLYRPAATTASISSGPVRSQSSR
jgi:hypothetical protein